MGLSKIDKKKLCTGCRANRYNMGRGYQESEHDAPVGCDECMHLSTATMADKLVYYSPGDYQPSLRERTLSCWHNNMGSGRIVPHKRVRG